MTTSDLPRAGLPQHQGRVMHQTLIMTRWIAVLGQSATIGFVYFYLGFNAPLPSVILTILAAALVNMVAMRQRGGSPLSESAASFYLVFDICQLAVLLSLTGGLLNPFAILLLGPLIVGATILSTRRVVMLMAVTLLAVSVLAVAYFPLPWFAGAPFNVPIYYKIGLWIAICSGCLVIGGYTWLFAEQSRRLADALSASHLALARQQQLSAIGALAASAAHELGNPLSTVTLVAKEMLNDMDEGHPWRDDAALIFSQAQRCREILASLSQYGRAENELLEQQELGLIIEELVEPYRRDGVVFLLERDTALEEAPIVTKREPELLHGLANILQNAMQYAQSQVVARLERVDAETVRLIVLDDGPGFSSAALRRLGEPYFSSRRGQDGHLGLGVFIAQNLLNRSGARISFANNPEGGARVVVSWSSRPPELYML